MCIVFRLNVAYDLHIVFVWKYFSEVFIEQCAMKWLHALYASLLLCVVFISLHQSCQFAVDMQSDVALSV